MSLLDNVKNAAEGLKKAEKLGSDAGDAVKTAKSVIQGAQKMEKLADLTGSVPEQLLAALRKLLGEAKQKSGKNNDLDACIQKAQKLLDSKDVSAEAVTKVTAELSALLKSAPSNASKQPETSSAQKSTPTAAPAQTKPAPKSAAPAAGTETPAKKTVHFSDVARGAYYYDAVQWAVQQGIASGTTETTFSPDQNCTRAQTITLLWRAAGSPAPKSSSNPFTDVKDTAYYRDAALWAAERGIVSGTAFEPDTAMTRALLATFLYKDAGSPAVESKNAFTDVPNDADYCKAVAWVAAKGITSGTSENTFSPDTVCTRGQIVTFLYRARK